MPRSERRLINAAIAGSLLLHLLLGLILAFFLAQEARSLAVAPETAIPPPEPEPREVMIFPEILKPQKLEEERPYVRTTQNAPEDNSPDRTQFQSDRNTTARPRCCSRPGDAAACLMIAPRGARLP